MESGPAPAGGHTASVKLSAVFGRSRAAAIRPASGAAFFGETIVPDPAGPSVSPPLHSGDSPAAQFGDRCAVSLRAYQTNFSYTRRAHPAGGTESGSMLAYEYLLRLL